VVYHELLNKAILESGLSLRQIAKRYNDLGGSITPSYISQLKNGKLPPPSADVTATLAKALNCSEESRLVFQGYLEKAPQVIKEYMLASSHLNKIMLESLCKVRGDDELTRSAGEFLSKLDVLSTVTLTSKYVTDGVFQLTEQFAKDLELEAKGLQPVGKEQIGYRLESDDMYPYLPKGCRLTLSPTSPSILKSKDIVVFRKGIKTMVRRIHFTGDEILLLPDNIHGEIVRIKSFDEIDYVGRVVSYQVDL
jgi:transcriptional regulator with XRE-family HTH domain